jgi:alpha-amylase/alpha-mannosidase (GH57 family)
LDYQWGMIRHVCIHCHFYQPPRENPWLGEVEVQDSAAPYHDWNARIAAECYGPCAKARIVDARGRIVNLIDVYSRISFNFGPTLLSWMARHEPRIHEAVVQADKASRKRFGGHGSAIAQVYNHMILPLAKAGDKRTQIFWGVEDFVARFGRDPEGMWLPECAVDTPSLEALADAGIKFVLLAQRQARRSRRLGRTPGPWRDLHGDMDPTAACRIALPSGRSMAAFFHDAAISSDLAFSNLAHDGQAFYDRLMGAFTATGRDWPQLVHVAADGETFGHHHPGGDMSLAYCLKRLEDDHTVSLTNLALYLAKHPPAFQVDIHENSSWSCVHGVERWRSDCGCNSGSRPGWSQAWRAPLRKAMDWLAARADSVFTEQGAKLFKDPAAACDDSIRLILDRSPENTAAFLSEHAMSPPSPQDAVTMLKLLEMARMAQLTFTSCGWFFDEISGIETVQVMQYAARCVELAEQLSARGIEKRFTAMLAKAPSNVLENGAKAYEAYARPARAGLRHVAAHAAVSALFSDRPHTYTLGSWTVSAPGLSALRSAEFSVASGQCQASSELTRESQDFVIAAVHMGGHHVSCGVDRFESADDLHRLRSNLARAFERGDKAHALSTLHSRFGEHTYSLANLFRDEQRAILDRVMAPALEATAEANRRIFQANLESLKFLAWVRSPLPREILDAGRNAVQRELEDIFTSGEVQTARLKEATAQARRWGLELDSVRLAVLASSWVAGFARRFAEKPRVEARLETLLSAVELCVPLSLPTTPREAQDACFEAARKIYPAMKAKGPESDWVKAFERLGRVLKVKVGAGEEEKE